MSRRHASARQLEREAEELASWGDGPVAAAIVKAETPARCRACDRPFVPGDQTGGTWVHDCTHVATAAAAAPAPSAMDAAHRCDASCDAELATLVRTATRASRRRVGGQGGGR